MLNSTHDVIDIDKIINEVEKHIRETHNSFRYFYPCQREALKTVLRKYVSNGYVSGIIQLPTGAGKTLLATSIILSTLSILKRQNRFGDYKNYTLCLFLAPLNVIKEQAYNTISKILKKYKENSESLYEVFIINSSSKLKSIIKRFFEPQKKLILHTGPRHIVIIMTPQLLDIIYNNDKKLFEQLINYGKIIILDEVHTFFVGIKTSKIIENIKEALYSGKIKVLIGLTATPVKEAIDLLGDIIYCKPSIEIMKKEEDILVPSLKIKYYNTIVHLKPLDSVERSGKNEWNYAIKVRAKEYAKIIINELRKIAEEAKLGKQRFPPKTLVVAPNTREADFLYEELQGFLDKRLKKIKIPLIFSKPKVFKAHYKYEKSRKEINKFKRSNRGILVAVNMVDIGFDDPDLEVLVIARPITSPIAYVQLRGRVLRKPKNENNIKNLLGHAIIIDLVGRTYGLENQVIYVEKGRYLKGINEVIGELKGLGKVPEADAYVTVHYKTEVTIGSSKSNKQKVNMIIENIKKKYQIMLYSTRSRNQYGITVKRIEGKAFNEINETIDISKTTIKLPDHVLVKIRRFIEAMILKDLREIKNKYPDVNIDQDTLVNEIYAYIEHEIKKRLTRIPRIHSTTIPIDLTKQVEDVLIQGKSLFIYKGHQVLLMKDSSHYTGTYRKYIIIYIDGKKIARIRAWGDMNKIIERLKNVLSSQRL